MRRRTLWLLGSVAVVALAIVGAFLLRKRAAPEPARLLPDADAYVYFNLKPLRKFGLIGKATPPRDDIESDYANFVRATGFEFERDLDEVAVAVHAAPRLFDAEPRPGEPEPLRRYSEVFRGRFDWTRVDTYFRGIARKVDLYRDAPVYTIPLEGRTVRVALLGAGIVAVSNTDGPQAIHYIIDRYKQVALPFGGPPLVKSYYRHVPFTSLLWGIARVNAQGGTPLRLPGGFDLMFPSDTVAVGSVRYTTAVDLKVEAFTPSPEVAKQIVERAGAFLSIFRTLEQSMNPSGADPDAKAFFNSLNVDQYRNRAILKANMPPAFLKKMFAGMPTQDLTGTEPQEQPEKAPEKKGGKRKQ